MAIQTLTRLSDKLLARDYVQEKVGEKYLVELIWSGANPSEIPFEGLPNRCIVKTNNGSGRNLILERPIDQPYVIERLHEWLKENYHWRFREYQYHNIKPQVIVEEVLDDGRADGPIDYRFCVFPGTRR